MRVSRTRSVGQLLVPAALVLGVVVVSLGSVTAAPPLQDVCPNACGIPGCQTCDINSGMASCTASCGGGETAVPPATQPAATLSAPQATAWADHQATAQAVQATAGAAVANATATAVAAYDLRCYSCAINVECPGGYASMCFEGDPAWGDVVHSVQCQSASECEPSSGPGDEACVPGDVTAQTGLGPITFDRCEGMEWTYDLWVKAWIPPHIVEVNPFPRWLVGMGASLPAPYESGRPGLMALKPYPGMSDAGSGTCEPEADGQGCWSHKRDFPDPVRPEDQRAVGDIRDYRVGLRWRRIDVSPGPDDPGPAPAICWDFDEREWNIGQDYGYGRVSNVACGTIVSHVYETASWDKPRNGPNFYPAEEVCSAWTEACRALSLPAAEERRCHCCEQVPAGEWNNPAYQIKVPTYWAVEWANEWERWEQVDCVNDRCECDPDPGEDRCEGAGVCAGHWKKDCDPVYDWVHHFEGWHLIDLRNHGHPNWYTTSWAVITTGSYAGCAYEYRDPDPGTTVRVPVVEVQVPLRDPCVIDGTCGEGYP